MATETTKLTYVEGAAAATPAAGRVVIYAKADGLMYSKDDAGAETAMAAGAAGAPTNADYLVGTTNGSLSNEIVVGATPGGELGGTWASPTVDATHSGSPHTRELDYVEITSPVNVTATTEGGADTIVTGSAVAYDGSTIVMIECWFPYNQQPAADTTMNLVLYDGASSIGKLDLMTNSGATGYAGNVRFPGLFGKRRLTPSAASHTYSIRAYVNAGTGVVGAGAGGSGNYMPGFIQINRV